MQKRRGENKTKTKQNKKKQGLKRQGGGDILENTVLNTLKTDCARPVGFLGLMGLWEGTSGLGLWLSG